MRKAIWSKVWLNDADEESALLFNECIEDLINNDMVKELDSFNQHIGTSRLQHSINVAYYSFLICRNLGLDYKSAARAGILHDLFLYDWRYEDSPEGHHISVHPREALKNAGSVTELNIIEKDAIVNHMWPLTVVPPRYLESHVLSLVDKCCACAEVIENFTYSLFNRSVLIKCMVTGDKYGK